MNMEGFPAVPEDGVRPPVLGEDRVAVLADCQGGDALHLEPDKGSGA